MRLMIDVRVCLSVAVLLISSAGYSQSLGDVARQQRQAKQAKDAQTGHKVITNEDMPEHPETSATDFSDGSDNSTKDASPVHARSAQQWKSAIQAQRAAIASLQNQIERVNSSIRFTGPGCVINCVQHNERQLQKEDDVERMRSQLEEQKRRLDEMQESARQDGFGNAVYEP